MDLFFVNFPAFRCHDPANFFADSGGFVTSSFALYFFVSNLLHGL